MYISRSSRMVIIPLQLRCCFFIEYILECWGPAMRNRVIRVYIFFYADFVAGFCCQKIQENSIKCIVIRLHWVAKWRPGS